MSSKGLRTSWSFVLEITVLLVSVFYISFLSHYYKTIADKKQFKKGEVYNDLSFEIIYSVMVGKVWWQMHKAGWSRCGNRRLKRKRKWCWGRKPWGNATPNNPDSERFCHLPRQRHHLVTENSMCMCLWGIQTPFPSFCFFLFSPRDSRQTYRSPRLSSLAVLFFLLFFRWEGVSVYLGCCSMP